MDQQFHSTNSLSDLFQAIANFQSDLPEIVKTKTADAGKFSYKYADLSNIWESIRHLMAKHKIAVLQMVQMSDDRKEYLETIVGHTSGAYLTSRYPLKDGSTPQQRGSELTYARRYALCAALGIAADEDEDGQLAQSAATKKKNTKKVAKKKTTTAKTGHQKAMAKLHAMAAELCPEDDHRFLRWLLANIRNPGDEAWDDTSLTTVTGEEVNWIVSFLSGEKSGGMELVEQKVEAFREVSA